MEMLTDEQLAIEIAARNACADDSTSKVIILPLLLEIRALRASQKWRPIEAAPRDGTEILATNDGYIYITHLCPVEEKWVAPYDEYNDKACFYSPTHWMPLPLPPKEQP